MKKVIKIICILLLVGLLLLLSVFIYHSVKLKNEYHYLKENGYIHLYDAGQYQLNVYEYGNKNGNHTIIGISGLGVSNFGIEMRYALEGIDNRFIFMDRAGYGYSDDTKIKQTTKQIVNDYRTVLKNAKIEGPYVLMAHSIGSVYTTYWESQYPDEIEGVILIDGSEIEKDIQKENEFTPSMHDYFEILFSKMGFGRFVLRKYEYPLPSLYTAEEQKVSDFFAVKSLASYALLSESAEANKNTNFTYDHLVQNDIPKIYISARNFTNKEEVKDYIKWLEKRQKETGVKVSHKELTDEDYETILETYDAWITNHTKPYIEKLGNTKIVPCPGDHMIFEYNPTRLNAIIKDYLNDLG